MHNHKTNGSFYFIECRDHLITSYILPDILILSSYVFGLYTFRVTYPEYLVTLIEKVNCSIVSVKFLLIVCPVNIVIVCYCLLQQLLDGNTIYLYEINFH